MPRTVMSRRATSSAFARAGDLGIERGSLLLQMTERIDEHGEAGRNQADRSCLCEAVREAQKNDAADAEAICEAAQRPMP
jgi:hypothetical protein